MSPRITVAVGNGAGPVVLSLHATIARAIEANTSGLRRRSMALDVGAEALLKARRSLGAMRQCNNAALDRSKAAPPNGGAATFMQYEVRTGAM
jgi:hypothetical protein